MDPTTVYLPIDQDQYYSGCECECWYDAENDQSKITTNPPVFTEFIPPHAGGPNRPLLYGFIIHVEPNEAYAKNPAIYQRDRDRLVRFGEVLHAHGARCTFQLQPPFTQVAVDTGDDIGHILEALGHDVGLHVHESTWLPPDATKQQWIDMFRRFKVLTSKLVSKPIICWSGGCQYEYLSETAWAAGLWVNTNFKIKETQEPEPAFLTTSPWRPAATLPPGALVYDPTSPRVYVPVGLQPGHCTKVDTVPRPFTRASFDIVTRNLVNSLRTCRVGYVNAAMATLHPNDFGRDPNLVTVDEEMMIWDQWLAQVVAPAVGRGQIQHQLPSEMGRIFAKWEKDNGLRP